MTLVIAQRIGNQISLSSDSRISFGINGFIDYGIKIFTIPVKIYSPVSSETNNTSLDYNYNLGLAFAGSTTNAYTVKESVYEILQNLQYIPGHTDTSFDGIAGLVFKVFKKTTLDFGEILFQNGLCDLILTGFCPNQNKIRIFRYTCDITENPIRPFYDEILRDDGIAFLGSGKPEAEVIYNLNNSLSTLHIIKQVINDGYNSSVGGGLQYGEFESNNFKIFGIQDYLVKADGSIAYLMKLRGINIYKDEFEMDSDGFHIAYTFKAPFTREINQIWKLYNDSL